MLPYIEVIDEVLLLTQSHQREQKDGVFEKTKNIAQANNRDQTSETNGYTEIQLQFITNGGIPSIAPGLQKSLNSSTVATVSFTRPSGR